MKKLSESKVKSLKAKEKRYSVSDGNGLFLDIMTSGKKSWILKFKKNSKETRKKLGEYPTLSLKNARELAEKMKRDAIMGVSDITVIDLVNEYHDIYSKNWSSDKYKRNVKYRLELITNDFQQMKASDVTRAIVSEAVKTIMAKGTLETARRCLRLLSSVYDYAIACEYCNNNPCLNVGKLIPETETKSMPCLTFDEMDKLWQDISFIKADYELKQALMLYCLLAVRPKELIEARWDTNEIDFDTRIWTIPAYRMKKRREHIVFLADKALAIFQNLYDNRVDDGYIFKNRLDPTRHKKIESVLAVIKRCGYGGRMTTHGFRSLLSTTANESKLFDGDVVERHLAHFPTDKVRHAYNRAEYWEQRKELMIWWNNQTDGWFE